MVRLMKRPPFWLLVAFIVGMALLSTVVGKAQAPAPAMSAAPPPAAAKIDSGDTAWVLASAALVMLMTPGLAFFYGGLVRKKNVLSMLMQCFMILCLISLQWVLFGYSLAFGPDMRRLHRQPGLVRACTGVGAAPNPDYAADDPAPGVHDLPDDVRRDHAGADHRRVRRADAVLGLLRLHPAVGDAGVRPGRALGLGRRAASCGTMGALDFAGGTVVHINAGMAALAAALVLGKRQGYPDRISPPHNLPFAVLGAALLWFGWFGFNAGSALAANGLAASAFVVTHMAAAAAGLTWASGLDLSTAARRCWA